MNILHATTEPDLLTRLREMLDSSARADIAVGYFFMSGFEAVADSLKRLNKVRTLVGRADRPALESVALGLQQSDALRARLDADGMVQRRQREAIAREAVDGIATGVSLLPPRPASRSGPFRCCGTWCRRARWRCGPVAARSTPRPTCAGTTTTPSRARRWSARPT